MARKKKKNVKMMVALSVGAVLNILILLLLGGLTVYRYTVKDSIQLEAPPPLERLELTRVVYNQSMAKDREKKSARPRQKRITVANINNIAAPEIQNLAGGMNIAVNVDVGDDEGLGGLGELGGSFRQMGESAVDFFGVQASGERVIIILDVAPSMLSVERGDIPGFNKVKERLGTIVDSLNSATLFNVFVYSSGLDVMSNNLVLANAENKMRARRFIEPYWKAENGRFLPGHRKGVYLRNYEPEIIGPAHIGGSSRIDLALLAAFEQKADAVFLITDGTPNYRREFKKDEIDDYEDRLADYEKRLARVTRSQMRRYEKEAAKHMAKGTQKLEAENRRREARGLDKKAIEGRPVDRLRPPWGWEPWGHVLVEADPEFVEWIRGEAERLYGKGSKNLPLVNIVGYSIDDDGETGKFLKSLSREFPKSKFDVFGKFRPERG
ncbi:MAG: hypothetical protein ACPGN3_08725 [Opitutales bacterium]